MAGIDEEKIAAGIRGTVKQRVLEAIEHHPKTLSDLGKVLKKKISNLSPVIKGLEDAELLVCLNPEDAKFKHYRITPRGLKVLDQIKKMDKDVQAQAGK